MSTPPPGGWQPYQPGQPPQGGVPPYGPPPGNYSPASQPGGFPQGGWPQPPKAPRGGNTTKFLLIAIAVLLVIGVTIGATLLLTRGTGDPPNNPSDTGNASDVASSGDVGPVSIVTAEPTCEQFNSINNGLADVEANGWGARRGSLGLSSSWTAEERTQTEAVASAMRNAADLVVPLSRQTPHRLIRELYGQFAAYARAYASSISSYQPVDDNLATANISAGAALISICNAITYGSAGRSVAVAAAPMPTSLAQVGDINTPKPFISSPGATCADWVARDAAFESQTSDWAALDANIPGSDWTPAQRTVQLATLPKLSEWADKTSSMGDQGQNPVLADFANAAALYVRAYLTVGDQYVKADSFLTTTAFRISNVVAAGCDAAGG